MVVVMFKYIKGNVTELGANYIVIENGNIGYLVYVANPYTYVNLLCVYI